MGMQTELRLKRQKKKRNTTFIILTAFGLFFLLAAGLMAIFNSNKASLQDISITPARVNYPAPELTLENIKGNMESLANFKGQVVLVNNWATWCPPCQAEMPTLVDFYNDYASAGLMIVAIEAGEPQSEVQKFVDQYQMPFHVWLDPKGKSAYAFNNNALPNSYVIDRSGTVRLSWTGEINRAMLEKYVTPLLMDN
jgi:DsbE subfamily thiol:disulfide oxidoreductase